MRRARLTMRVPVRKRGVAFPALLARGFAWVLWCCLPSVLAEELAGAADDDPGMRVPVQSWNMAERTLVLFNPDFPGSRELATYYAERRGIPPGQVVGLSCPAEETIDRATFEGSIRGPLRELFEQRGWWADGEFSGSPRIRVICPVRGIPLRVGRSAGEPRGPGLRISAASVDAELTLLGHANPDLVGPMSNPYFRRQASFSELGEHRMMLVSRLDGPSDEIVRSMIDGAIAAEREGLWGKAYVDLAAEDRPGYMVGDRWLEDAAGSLWAAGIPVVEDPHSQRFPFAYPMRDAIFYLGWYTDRADGPFADPGFRMRPGAVACHIHSFSAETVRDAGRNWVGPLVAHGAAVALGSVDEPLLQLTVNLDVFTDRLLRGYSVAEAAWMATPALSWMNTVLGDPLYRPFAEVGPPGPGGGGSGYGKDKGYRAVREALLGGGGGDSPGDRLREVAEAMAASGDAVGTEALGLYLLDRGDPEGAIACFERAGELFQADADRVRAVLHVIDTFRRTGKMDQAEARLREFARKSAGIPAGRAVETLLLQLDPPPPDFPVPSRRIPFHRVQQGGR